MIARLFLFLSVLSLAACQPGEDSRTLPEKSPAGLDQTVVTVTGKNGAHKFTVEIARSPEEQAYGLMNRQSLAPDRGMLFPYAPPQEVSFWMRDTYIPLDLLFVAPGGTIRHIESQAVPLSLDPLLSNGPVEAVVEIAGGRAAEMGIAVGDTVDWPR